MFRPIVKLIIATILRFEARLILKKYQPRIIAITGSVGKTGTKDAIASVLAGQAKVRASQKSFNSELGVPLTIIGCDNPWWNPFGWLKVFVEGLGLILFRSNYPECLVLEIGVDRPGDMKSTLAWLKIDVAVLTNLPEVPVHVEFFKSPEEVVKEKWLLAQAVPATGLVIYNHDDAKLKALASELKCRNISYGFQEGATVRGSDIHINYQKENTEKPEGLGLRVDYDGKSVPFNLPGVLGAHQLYSLLAATAVGVSEEINLIKISEVLARTETPPGRMKLLAGLKETLIIDDTYNSSPAALEAGLNTLSELRIAGRKIAVLGDMLELGKYTIDEHRKAGILASRVAQVLVTVGLRMKFAVEEAMRKKMGKKNVYHFDDSRQAGEFLQNFIAPADVILVKGSQSLRMERVVEEIMANPEEKSKLLVRQDSGWSRR